jgi:hypothetical protein
VKGKSRATLKPRRSKPTESEPRQFGRRVERVGSEADLREIAGVRLDRKRRGWEGMSIEHRDSGSVWRA